MADQKLQPKCSLLEWVRAKGWRFPTPVASSGTASQYSSETESLMGSPEMTWWHFFKSIVNSDSSLLLLNYCHSLIYFVFWKMFHRMNNSEMYNITADEKHLKKKNILFIKITNSWWQKYRFFFLCSVFMVLI